MIVGAGSAAARPTGSKPTPVQIDIYADRAARRYPITSEGRLVAVFLMAAGVGLFGTLSGAVASWFLSPATKEADVDLQEVKVLLLEMRNRLKESQSEWTQR